MTVTPPIEAPAPPPRPVLDLLREERYGEALALLPSSPRDPDALLLRASLLIHGGEIEAAKAACLALLQLNELSAGAHHLLALCCESAGDLAGSVRHDQIASYLEPSFAMPALHSGLVLRRSGNLLRARKELCRALLLLPEEDASRLVLFGGGFHRDALLSLCKAELKKLEGQA